MQEFHTPEHRAKILGSDHRRAWLNTEGLFEKADIEPGMVCVDLGCGAGAVSLPLATEVGPEGKVYAVDINRNLLEAMKDNDPPAWHMTLQRDAADTGLDPQIADTCFMILILHEVPPEGLLKESFRLLKPGGKAVVLEWKYDMERPHPPKNERIADSVMETMLAENGYKDILCTDWSDLHYVMTAVKP